MNKYVLIIEGKEQGLLNAKVYGPYTGDEICGLLQFCSKEKNITILPITRELPNE